MGERGNRSKVKFVDYEQMLKKIDFAVEHISAIGMLELLGEMLDVFGVECVLYSALEK